MFSLFHITSTIVVLMIGVGLLVRRNRKMHIRLMSTAFVLDMVSLLGVEFSRQAVEKIVGQQVPPLTVFHATISVMLLVAWVAMIFLGRKILSNQPNARQNHKRMSVAFIALRLTNYVTSFMV